ncbi:DUF5602 domain-containing protein [Halomonas nitroreducens]|uniref:Uncharacterized protein n=1 Tax=Halomonas nitroreducens TaxID=447425 RepID=A0A431V248_9GAMM|nr:DUF5602 domain-containing protein [Halomonas nitroreducens]RTR01079.1 hypothetical protein EKG36_14530 [Halomonas nitroreducens]
MNIMSVAGFRRLGGVSALALVMAATALPAVAERVSWGDPVAVGNGQARVAVSEQTDGIPSSVAVVLSAGVLEGLPVETPDQHEWEYLLPMPDDSPITGYRHVGLNWNPIGHIPEGIYSVPHFDVHFYLIDAAEQQAITFQGPDREARLIPPESTLVPAGYVIPPDSAVERMGVHGIDTDSEEFQGQPFTRTFVYGYDTGRLIFIEPMIALDYLRSRPDATLPVRTPAAYSSPGYYPGRYRVAYEPATDEYRVELLELRPFPAMPAKPL